MSSFTAIQVQAIINIISASDLSEFCAFANLHRDWPLAAIIRNQPSCLIKALSTLLASDNTILHIDSSMSYIDFHHGFALLLDVNAFNIKLIKKIRITNGFCHMLFVYYFGDLIERDLTIGKKQWFPVGPLMTREGRIELVQTNPSLTSTR
ncbi:Hypothetical protein MVR_LOCUS77 [uncultured virus]|nr:Hypothetical protein MVR_LOCUS77 [uncultured virus]